MKLTLDKKILIGFLTCSVILIVVTVISFRNSRQFIDTTQLVNHTHEVLHELEQVLVSAVNAETSARGFVIVGKENYLDLLGIAEIKIYEHIEKTRQLTTNNAEVQRILEKVERLIDLRIAHLKRYAELRKTAGFEEAKAVVDSGEGKQLQDQIRALIDDAKKIEEALLIERRTASEEDANDFNLIFIALLSIITVTLFIVYAIIVTNLRALRKAELETADKNWSLTGSSELVRDMQGNKRLKELSGIIINHLTKYLNAQIGAIYVVDKNALSLQLEGAYAFDKRKANAPVIKLGEGIVGQAATGKRTILLTNIPRDYFNIDTGFGELYPKNIIAKPFVFEDKVIGVVELGSIYNFTELQKEYLNLVIESISIALTSSQSREKAKELLEETQRQAEELEVQQKQLEQSNEELLKIQMDIKAQNNIINSVAIVSRADIRGDITYVNDEFLKWAKYSKHEVMGKNHRILKSGYQPEEIFANLWRTVSSGKIWRGELKNKAKDGSYYWVDAIIAPVLDHNGKPKEYIAQLFVINDKKRREEDMKKLLEETQQQSEELEIQQHELKQANEELKQKANILEEQQGRLENANKEIEVANKYKSEFLANMSHELRTPLNSILILSQILQENRNKTLGVKEAEYAKNIHSSGTDLLTLINEILDLSKVESGKMQLDISELWLQDLIESMDATFSEVAKDKIIGFQIIFNNEVVPPMMTTDRQRMEQVLKNLLSNAFKFTDKKGEIKLTIDRASSEITFNNKNLSNTANVLAFSVSDTGIGIPPDKLGIIFEAFQQADGSTKRKYGGTGLGLSISRELAYVLGGELHVESEVGRGSTFTLYLPAQFNFDFIVPVSKQVEIKPLKKKVVKDARSLIQTEDAFDDRNQIQENDRVILIIEDEEKFASLLLDFIRSRNYKGIIAHQGNTGISYARHFKPDAIILDMKLPIMEGTEVLRQIKNDPDLRHIPVQIISAYDQKKEGLELGAFDYIRKPVSTGDLQSAFDKIENFTNKKLKKLLIIEDNKQQNQAIRELIGNGDVKCFSAYSGNEAGEIMSKEFFDCVIVDLGLPDTSGFELLERMRENARLNKIPIIVYTGKDLKKEDNERLDKLANTVVLKTADSQERLLDETILFLHRVESRLPKEKQSIIRKLHKSDEILKNKKILLVDDDIRNIYSLTNFLEEEGVECITAENGKAALDILKKNPTIDLVLMDIMMPEMDGYEATLEIRGIDKLKKLPIIALTAKAMKGDKEKCLAVGMSDYISKPIDLEQLVSLLRVWLYK